MQRYRFLTSVPEKRFSMEYIMKNVSKFSDGENQWSDEMIWRNLIWKLKISKLGGFLNVFVYCCQISDTWIKDCQIFAEVTCKIEPDNRKTHYPMEKFDIKPPTKMEDPVIGFQKFLKWDEMEENFLIADSVKIVVFVDRFATSEDRGFLRGKFRVLHTFKNLARFEENETQFSDVKECAGTSWRICIKKEDGYLGFYLQCESNINTSLIWSITTVCNLHIQCKDNYKLFDLGDLKFGKHTRQQQGNNKLIKWEDLISNYLVNDKVTIEAELKVFKEYPDKENSMAKKIVLSHKFSDVSRIEEGESRFSKFEKRFNIPWKIELKRVSGFLEIHLYCGVENATFVYTKIETECWFNLVSTNGKNLMIQVYADFYKNGDMRNLKKAIRWDDMMTDYVINDSFIIEARIDILNITEKEFNDIHWSFGRDAFFYERRFFITCKVNNVSRFQDGEKQWGNTELRYDIPWRIQARKTLDFLELYFFCDEGDHGSKKLIQTKCTFNLVSTSGNKYIRASKLNFGKPGGQGINKFIKWNDMIESFLNPLEDSLIVEAHVKIYMVEEFSRNILQNERSFLMSHIVRDVSNAEEGNVVFCATEEWYDVQWSVSIKYINGFVELLLSCDKEFNAYEAWSIEARVQLILVGANGKRLTDYFEHTFEKPDSIGDLQLIRWEDMLDQYAVEDSLTVETRVVYTQVTYPLPEYSFILSHTVKKISNVREGEFNFSKTEKHFDAPWRISLKKRETCLLIHFHCDKVLSNDEHWSIQVEVQLVLVSETGRTLTDKVTHIFNEPEGIHWNKRLEWEDMKRDFMVEDSVKIEARVNIMEPVEIDNEDWIDDEDERWSI